MVELSDELEDFGRFIPGVPEDADSILGRPGENRVKRWILLDGGRLAVATALLAIVLLALVVLGTIRPVEMRTLLAETNNVQMLFNTMLSGIILLVSIVVSISSVVLSQELTSLDDQHERVRTSIEFRRDIESLLDRPVSPTAPSEFLAALLENVEHQVLELQDVCAEDTDEEVRAIVDAFVDSTLAHTDEVNETLMDSSTGTSTVLLAGLGYDYSWQIYASRQLRKRYGDRLPAEAHEILDDLLEALTYFATGREYFKTLYYEQEFANLSRTLLYVSLPAIVFMSHVLLALDGSQFPDVSLFGLSPLLLYVSFAYTVALAPYLVLTSYVLRAAVVSLRTLASGPFIVEHDSIDPRDEPTPVNLDDN